MNDDDNRTFGVSTDVDVSRPDSDPDPNLFVLNTQGSLTPEMERTKSPVTESPSRITIAGRDYTSPGESPETSLPTQMPQNKERAVLLPTWVPRSRSFHNFSETTVRSRFTVNDDDNNDSSVISS